MASGLDVRRKTYRKTDKIRATFLLHLRSDTSSYFSISPLFECERSPDRIPQGHFSLFSFLLHPPTHPSLPEKNANMNFSSLKLNVNKNLFSHTWHSFKGCGMGTLFLFVCLFCFVFLFPCFRENVVVTCKIGSFLCSLDNLLQKNVIVFFFGNQISKWRSFEKKGKFLTYFIFLVTRESYKNSFSAYLTHIHTRILLTQLTFFLPYQFWKKNTNLSDMVSLWYESWCWFLFAPFGTVNK